MKSENQNKKCKCLQVQSNYIVEFSFRYVELKFLNSGNDGVKSFPILLILTLLQKKKILKN